jgi:hypothetical protein
MKRVRAFLDRFTLGSRPPTGPLTTEEASDAQALQEKLSKDDDPDGRKHEESSDRPDHGV